MRNFFITLLVGGLLLGAGCIPEIKPGHVPPNAVNVPDNNTEPTSLPASSTSPGEGIACTMEYRPVCGFVPVVCVRAPCNPVPQTFSNRCMANAGGAVEIIEGVCAENQTYPPSTSQDK